MTLAELLEYVKAGGGVLAPVFAILWWMERDERRDAQKELKAVTKESVAAITDSNTLVGQLVTIFKPAGSR